MMRDREPYSEQPLTESHYCPDAQSLVYCDRLECPYCPDPEGDR